MHDDYKEKYSHFQLLGTFAAHTILAKSTAAKEPNSIT